MPEETSEEKEIEEAETAEAESEAEKPEAIGKEEEAAEELEGAEEEAKVEEEIEGAETVEEAEALEEEEVEAAEEEMELEEEERRPRREEEEEIEIVEERIYTIPLRRAWLMPSRRRAPKAMRIIRSFVQRHMKVGRLEEGEEELEEEEKPRVIISNELNEYVWRRGAEKPPRKVRVRAVKDKEGYVTVYPA